MGKKLQRKAHLSPLFLALAASGRVTPAKGLQSKCFSSPTDGYLGGRVHCGRLAEVSRAMLDSDLIDSMLAQKAQPGDSCEDCPPQGGKTVHTPADGTKQGLLAKVHPEEGKAGREAGGNPMTTPETAAYQEETATPSNMEVSEKILPGKLSSASDVERLGRIARSLPSGPSEKVRSLPSGLSEKTPTSLPSQGFSDIAGFLDTPLTARADSMLEATERRSPLTTTLDNPKLLSMAVQPPSEADEAALNTRCILEAEEDTMKEIGKEGQQFSEDPSTPQQEGSSCREEPASTTKPHNLSESTHHPSKSNSQVQELAPGMKWQHRWTASPISNKKRPMDDSALVLEADGHPETLEKLWPLMAAVQRRQNAGGSSPATHSPPFRLTDREAFASVGPMRAHNQKMSRAQAEFLALHRHKSASSKHPFFNKHGASPVLIRGGAREGSNSLKYLEPRRERRMDPRERVLLWLEQGEQYQASQSPKKDVLRGPSMRSKKNLLPPPLPKAPKTRRKTLERLFSCFALS